MNPTQGSLKIDDPTSSSSSSSSVLDRLSQPSQQSHQQNSLMHASKLGLGNHPPSTNLRIKPKWPNFLIDKNFDVMKINQYGTVMIVIIIEVMIRMIQFSYDDDDDS
jgi:hypothetical protein